MLLPGFIIVGLCAIPYLDTNPKGNGYYTFEERPFAVTFFWVGFILFWVSLVILGTFLRGPNWSFFGPFEYWDLHKLEPLVNVNLSTVLLGQPARPAAARQHPGCARRRASALLARLLPAAAAAPRQDACCRRHGRRAWGTLRFNVFIAPVPVVRAGADQDGACAGP